MINKYYVVTIIIIMIISINISQKLPLRCDTANKRYSYS
uniref:Uncharacterized protein n=1 Tax=Arundo donax TaxID=35708 RepID=A0A0A9EB36_ARUDO